MSLYEGKYVLGLIVLYQREQVIGSRWKRGVFPRPRGERVDYVRQRNNGHQSQQ